MLLMLGSFGEVERAGDQGASVDDDDLVVMAYAASMRSVLKKCGAVYLAVTLLFWCTHCLEPDSSFSGEDQSLGDGSAGERVGLEQDLVFSL